MEGGSEIQRSETYHSASSVLHSLFLFGSQTKEESKSPNADKGHSGAGRHFPEKKKINALNFGFRGLMSDRSSTWNELLTCSAVHELNLIIFLQIFCSFTMKMWVKFIRREVREHSPDHVGLWHPQRNVCGVTQPKWRWPVIAHTCLLKPGHTPNQLHMNFLQPCHQRATVWKRSTN